MKRTYQENKSLYESIMRDVAKIVKHHLNEMSPAVYSNAANKKLENFVNSLSEDEVCKLSKQIFDYIENDNEWNTRARFENKMSRGQLDALLNFVHKCNYKSPDALYKILAVMTEDTSIAHYVPFSFYKEYPQLKTIFSLKDHSKHIMMDIEQLLELGIIEDKGELYRMTVKYDLGYSITKHLNITFEDVDYNNVILAAVAVGESFRILSKFGKETNIINEYATILKRKVWVKDNSSDDHSTDYDYFIKHIEYIVKNKYGNKNIGQIILNTVKEYID